MGGAFAFMVMTKFAHLDHLLAAGQSTPESEL